MSALLSQLKSDGLSPSDPTLFNKAISSISCTLASQTLLAAAMSDFVVSKCKESHLAHVSIPISASQKREQLVSLGSDSSLFDQSLLERVSGQVKEDSFISSSLSLAKLPVPRQVVRVSPPLPLALRLLLEVPLRLTILGMVHPDSASGPLPLPAVAVVRGVAVAGACLLLRLPVRVFESMSHVPVP